MHKKGVPFSKKAFSPFFDPDSPTLGFSGLTALLCVFVIVNVDINSDWWAVRCRYMCIYNLWQNGNVYIIVIFSNTSVV